MLLRHMRCCICEETAGNKLICLMQCFSKENAIVNSWLYIRSLKISLVLRIWQLQGVKSKNSPVFKTTERACCFRYCWSNPGMKKERRKYNPQWCVCVIDPRFMRPQVVSNTMRKDSCLSATPLNISTDAKNAKIFHILTFYNICSSQVRYANGLGLGKVVVMVNNNVTTLWLRLGEVVVMENKG